MTILIEKSAHRLTAERDGQRFCCRVALGRHPVGHKQCEGDGKTPEGEYYICLKRETGKFGCALGISYPSALDARQAVHDGHLPADLLPLFEAAQAAQKRPPWGTSLGGEIYIHGGGNAPDWTAGCIALSDADMAVLFAMAHEGDTVRIIP